MIFSLYDPQYSSNLAYFAGKSQLTSPTKEKLLRVKKEEPLDPVWLKNVVNKGNV